MFILELFFASLILYLVLFNPMRHQAIPNFIFNIHSSSIYVSYKRDRSGRGNILDPLVEKFHSQHLIS